MQRRQVLICATGFLLAGFPMARAIGQCTSVTETKSISLYVPAANDFFGSAVSLSGDDAIIGAREDSSRSGSAYVFGRNTGGPDNWGQAFELIPNNPIENFAEFGISVDASGDFAIVGAHFENTNGLFDAGAAYIFDRNVAGPNSNWAEVARLVAVNGQGNFDGGQDDRFGFSVAVSGDVALVGAFRDDDFGSNSGSAYFFRRDPVSGDWNFEQKLSGTVLQENFGYSVALDGDLAAIGARGDNSSQGAVHVYRLDGGTGIWGLEQKLTASDGLVEDEFGNSVAVSGDLIVAGAHLKDECALCLDCTGGGFGFAHGGAYVFRFIAAPPSVPPWNEEIIPLPASSCALGSDFGKSVDVFNGNVVIGTNIEKTYFYLDNGGIWDSPLEMHVGSGGSGELFGAGVAVGGDHALVGASMAGSVESGRGYMFGGLTTDCYPTGTPNGIPDICDIAAGAPDCNANAIPDSCDIAAGTSADCNGNLVPDSCDVGVAVDYAFVIDASQNVFLPSLVEAQKDAVIECICGANPIIPYDGTASVVLIALVDESFDPLVIERVVIDSTEAAMAFCAQVSSIIQGVSNSLPWTGPMQARAILAVEGESQVRRMFMSVNPDIGGNVELASLEIQCAASRTALFPIQVSSAYVNISGFCNFVQTETMKNCANVESATTHNPGQAIGIYGCMNTAVELEQWIRDSALPTPTSNDCNQDGVPDFCQFALDPTQDCNGNGLLDSCDITSGRSLDCNFNRIPDECDTDCNFNGVPDSCEITACAADITPQPCGNGTVNIDDLVAVLSGFGPCPILLAPCPADITPQPGGNGVVNIDDLVAVLNAFGPCTGGSSSGATGMLQVVKMDFSDGWVDASGALADPASNGLISAAWAVQDSQIDCYRLFAQVESTSSTLTYAGGGLNSGPGGMPEPLVLNPGKGAQFYIPIAGSYAPPNVALFSMVGDPNFQLAAFGTYLTFGMADGSPPVTMGNTASLDGLLTGFVNAADAGWGVYGAVAGQGVVSDGNGGWRVLIGQFAVPKGKTFTAAVRLAGDGIDVYATVNSGVTTLP